MSATPPVVEGSPEYSWLSIDDVIWLAWRDDGNLLEAHEPGGFHGFVRDGHWVPA